MELHVIAANLSGKQAPLTKRALKRLQTDAGSGGAGYLLIKVKQRRSVVVELSQKIDGDVSDTKVVPAFRQENLLLKNNVPAPLRALIGWLMPIQV